MHPRRVIRDAVVALLTGATAAGGRVSATRVEPHRKSDLPAISVYTLSEQVEPDGALAIPREIIRVVNVEIAGWVAHSDASPADDAMDALAEQIEVAMDADPYLGGAAGDSILESTEMTVRAEDGRSDPLVGIVTLTYSVTYRTSPAAPANLDEFILAGVTTQIVGAEEDNAADDLVVVQPDP